MTIDEFFKLHPRPWRLREHSLGGIVHIYDANNKRLDNWSELFALVVSVVNDSQRQHGAPDAKEVT